MMLKIFFYCLCLTSMCIFAFYFTGYNSVMEKPNSGLTRSIQINETGESQIERARSHFVVHSAFFYKISKLYSPNSMIVLMNAERDLEMIPFYCHSNNSTKNLTTKSSLRAIEPGPFCRWITYIINCTTVSNPKFFGLALNNDTNIIKIKFEYPEQKKYPVIMCYPQMVYESRWQQIIFATEIYRHFGADLQIQYINSAMTQIVDILEIYERKGWIKIEKFAYIDFDSKILSLIGYPPMLELDSRNQPLSYTNCLMKYRESSEFIIVADVDDVLIPKRQNFYKEFSHWSKIYPNAPAFMYYRSNGEINVSNSFESFSLYNAFTSLTIDNSTYDGKSVYQTKIGEAAWLHWPSFKNESTAVISPVEGKIYHMHIFNITLPKKFDIISNDKIKRITSKFEAAFKEFPSFRSNTIYADAITECYRKLVKWDVEEQVNKRRPCLSPLYCLKNIDYVKGFKCKVAKRNFLTKYLNESIAFHLPNSEYYWWKNDHGCKIFLY